MEICKTLENQKFSEFIELVIETCAYAGSGNVLKVQKMLHLCAEHKKDAKDSMHQIAAVIGVALIAFGEQIGTDMCLRTMNHLMHYGEPVIRKTVPLAIGLLRVSNPEVKTSDLLNKLAYDSDADVALSSIFALGLVGAGTNNSKLAGNLRQLGSYYKGGETTQNQLFMVRIAQGLVHMGKVSPFLHANCLLGIAWSESVPFGQVPLLERVARRPTDSDLRRHGHEYVLLRELPLLPVLLDPVNVPAHDDHPQRGPGAPEDRSESRKRGRHCGPRRPPPQNHRLPDARHARVAGTRRKSGVRHGAVHRRDVSAREFCDLEAEP